MGSGSVERASVYARLLAPAPVDLDLTNEVHLEQVQAIADTLLEEASGGAELTALETRLAADRDRYPLAAHLAVKLARSKRILARGEDAVHVTVVFAVYKEHTRILTRARHPHGEDFLRRKIGQLRWLFEADPRSDWELLVVDDGCPEASGRLAGEVVEREGESDRVRILFLEDAIRQGLPVTHPMTSTADSQKGGSIEYGLWAASREPRRSHIVLYTDADLSTHLGQVGLLVGPIAEDGAVAAIGSRREPLSIAVKKGVRNVRGKLFIYLWKRVLPQLNHVVDTQCGFKAFRADLAAEIALDTIEKRFAFDIELLLKTELRSPGKTAKVPVAWIDSEAASTTTDIQPYLAMLQGIVRIYRRYLPPSDTAEPFAALIDGLDEPSWQRLVERIPPEIAGRQPAEFDRFDAVSAAQLHDLLD